MQNFDKIQQNQWLPSSNNFFSVICPGLTRKSARGGKDEG
jgi:hypothetical protein